MRVEILGIKGTWRDIANSANTTIGKNHNNKEISSSWKHRMLLCEHSPIRQLIVKWRWIDLQYWVSVHFVRHKIGIEHWVKTQRSDRTGIDRNDMPQGALVTHECEANAQSIIAISRKRLCNCASPETREAWNTLLDSLYMYEPELVGVCVPDCVYRGECYEFKTCGWSNTITYNKELKQYKGGK